MKIADQITVALGVVGVVLVTAGVGMMHTPSGLIAAGFFALARSYLASRASASRKDR